MLENMEDLVGRLSEKIDSLLEERGKMYREIVRLRARLAERDQDSVNTSKEMQVELEKARVQAMCLEQERARAFSKLQELDDKLLSIAENGHGGK